LATFIRPVTNRILDLSDSPARLSTRLGLLVVRRDYAEEVTVPLGDVAVLVVAHAQVSYTHAVLAELMQAGGAFVTCDDKRLPVGMLLPLNGHFAQVERFAAQAALKLPVKKRLWRQLVRAKLAAQGRLLQATAGSDYGLTELAKTVRSGDPANVEAQGARRYWSALFPDRGFRRDRAEGELNALLNYGYAVLRAIVARGICAAGLHPSLGLHHHNRYSGYALADDLMEPLRPLVDRTAYRLLQAGVELTHSSAIKRELLAGLARPIPCHGEERSLFDVAARLAASLARVTLGKSARLSIAEL
jgi:CRISPR-associated protein Cas1